MSKKITQLSKKLREDSEARTEASRIMQDLLSLATLAASSSDGKFSKAVALGSSLITIGASGKSVWDFFKRYSAPDDFTIKISESDPIFDVVEEWFMEALPEDSQRSIFAGSEIVKNGRVWSKSDDGSDLVSELLAEADEDPEEQRRVDIVYSFDGTIVQDLDVAGHTVQIFTTSPELYGSNESQGRGNFARRKSIHIVCKTVEARNDVLKEIEKQSQYLADSQPRMFISSKWGDFRKRSYIQPRSMESVVLKEGQMERIISHLTSFLNNKEAYRHADIPFRTGILLYGDPGSGKSSTALAIANALKMNVYIIALSALGSDDSLNDCFGSIPPNSIIILEDIDIASAVKDRDDDDDNGVTMSGMLNVLDGFQSPPGVITIMTTNRKDVLDPAIIRPGRVDLEEHLDCLDTYQLEGLCKYFIGSVPEGLPEISPSDGITSAEFMGIIRKHLPDFDKAGPDVVEFVKSRLEIPTLKVAAA